MADNPGPVLELVIYKLNKGESREKFLEASESMSSWAKRQPGFISRTLSYNPETDTYFYVVYWRSMADAQAAVPAAQNSEECAPAFAMIDSTTVQFHHGIRQAEPITA